VHGPQTGVCRACGELTDAFSNASCMRCGSSYHLALRQDVPAKDCGQVWIDDESQTLEFACNVCLGVVGAVESDQEMGERAGYARSEGGRASELLRRKRAERRRRGV
jgi:hypothetical protein